VLVSPVSIVMADKVLSSELATYTCRPSAVTATPAGRLPTGIGASITVARIGSITDTVRVTKFATYNVVQSRLGAVVAYIALDVTAVASQDVRTVRAAYLAMELLVWYVIVPLALASVLIGIVNAVGTSWGLFRHYWVVVKLLLTVVATAVLLAETQTAERTAVAQLRES
jgi:hypothetical protein